MPLLTLRNVALLDARVNLRRQALRQRGADAVNVRAGDAVAELRRDDVVRQRKGLVGDEAEAAVLGREDCEAGDGVAVRVNLRVQRALVKDIEHVGAQLVADDALLALGVDGAELGNGLGDETAGEEDEHLGGTGVDVQLADGAAYGRCQLTVFSVNKKNISHVLEDAPGNVAAAMLVPVPTMAGKVWRFAIDWKLFWPRSKTKSLSSDKIL